MKFFTAALASASLANGLKLTPEEMKKEMAELKSKMDKGTSGKNEHAERSLNYQATGMCAATEHAMMGLSSLRNHTS